MNPLTENARVINSRKAQSLALDIEIYKLIKGLQKAGRDVSEQNVLMNVVKQNMIRNK